MVKKIIGEFIAINYLKLIGIHFFEILSRVKKNLILFQLKFLLLLFIV